MDFDLGSIMSSFGAANSDGKVMGMDPNSLAIMAAMLGKGMSKPGSVGDVLGSGALNQIRTNKFGALLQKMLSNGGKMTMDGENTQLKIPHVGTSGEGSAFWDSGTLGSKLGSNLDNSLAFKLMKLMSEGGDDTGLPFFVNGSRGIDLNPSDLVGLTPGDVSTALELKSRNEAQGWDNLKSMIGIKHTLGLIDNLEFDNTLKFMQLMSKDDRSQLQKDFEEFNLGRVNDKLPPVSFSDFFMMTKNGTIMEYQKYRDQGGTESLNTWMTKIKKAGASVTDLGGVFDKIMTTKKAEGIADLSTPEFMRSIEKSVDKVIKDEDDTFMMDKNSKDPSVAVDTNGNIVKDKNGKPVHLTSKERRVAGIIREFESQAETVLGENRLVRKFDTKKPIIRWYDKKNNKLVRSWNYGG